MEKPERSLEPCASVGETLAYLIGQVSPDRSALMEAHINDCDYCREMTAHFARTIAEEDKEFKEFESSDLYKSTREAASELVLKRIKDEASPESSSAEVLRKGLFGTSTKQLLLAAASIAVILAIGLAAAIISRRNALTKADLERSLAALRRSTSAMRPLELRITGLDYAPYRMRGESSALGSEIEEAHRSAVAAVSRDPSPETRHMLGRVLIAEREYEAAEAQLMLALKGSPSNIEILIDLAVVRAAKGDREAALQDLNRVLMIAPNSLAGLFNRAALYQLLGRDDEARNDLQKYLGADSSSQWADEARERLSALK